MVPWLLCTVNYTQGDEGSGRGLFKNKIRLISGPEENHEKLGSKVRASTEIRKCGSWIQIRSLPTRYSSLRMFMTSNIITDNFPYTPLMSFSLQNCKLVCVLILILMFSVVIVTMG